VAEGGRLRCAPEIPSDATCLPGFLSLRAQRGNPSAFKRRNRFLDRHGGQGRLAMTAEFEFPARAGAEALPLVRFHPARPFAGLLLSWLSALLQNMPAPD